uniref:Leucine-rich repeat-containing N-terminal plant-type domain-containing protein n=1 Tax=Arundo donax TaxID=35708 RepID=A0A0A9AAD0_ARUDO
MGKAKLFAVLMTLAAAVASCLCGAAQGEPASVRDSLVGFLRALAGADEGAVRAFRWDASADPCGGGGAPWRGVICDGSRQVVKIVLAGHRGVLNGTVDAALLCAATALRVVSLRYNGLRGELPAGIAGCVQLSRLYLGGNQLAGILPASLARLRNLRVLDVSGNNFAGELPTGLSELELVMFRANDNHFSGVIPDFDLTRFFAFNVSSNSLTGQIPTRIGRFGVDSFWPNAAGLCGQPLFEPCPPSPAPQPSNPDGN